MEADDVSDIMPIRGFSPAAPCIRRIARQTSLNGGEDADELEVRGRDGDLGIVQHNSSCEMLYGMQRQN
jgi:hypothetical protein